MKATLLGLAAMLLAATPLLAQDAPFNGGKFEVVALARPGYILGVQGEYAGFGRVVPWVSARYGSHTGACDLDLFGPDCGDRGLGALAGVRLKAKPLGLVEPYLTFGGGPLWTREDDGELSRDVTGTAHVGVAWLGFGRVRPRIEFGFETGASPWMNVGIGLVP